MSLAPVQSRAFNVSFSASNRSVPSTSVRLSWAHNRIRELAGIYIRPVELDEGVIVYGFDLNALVLSKY